MALLVGDEATRATANYGRLLTRRRKRGRRKEVKEREEEGIGGGEASERR